MKRRTPLPRKKQKRIKGQKIICPFCQVGDPRRWWGPAYYLAHLQREHPQEYLRHT